MTNENDVERLKKKCPPMASDREIAEVRGWNHCIYHLTASGRLAGWREIETAPRDGTRILVYFKRHGWLTVFWGAPEHASDQTPYIWCVDDMKHGPYALRGYIDGDELGWMPLPPAPSARKEG